MNSLGDIRSTFLNYFQSQGHEVVASSSLVPENDPTLMFTNAGMVQFKNLFTGVETRKYQRATTSQKCVRAGGKHNDLDNVGYTARHHTFFEMLGNFSFGDYFKEEAILHAWTLVIKEYGLKPDNLLVTVYHTDDEAADLWKKIAGFSDDRIIRIPTSDNFWAMGDTGPCGPCSEIFIDQGDSLAGGPPGSADEDGDRFLEFWNLVFMQYEQVSPDKRNDLPRPSIDTGMGLERMSAIMQDVKSNYDTDLFKTLIGSVEDVLNRKAVGADIPGFRVIADHLRAVGFLIADGVMPSNEGRGYVLRRIMRRAMRYANMLGAKDPVIYQLVPTLCNEMGQAFPELARARSSIADTIKLEEERFQTTLGRGLGLLDEASIGMGKGDVFPGDMAFKLYDTYGFPLDLTQDALRLRGITVDETAFASSMARQKQEARASWAGSGGVSSDDSLWFDIADKHGATEFLGYDRTRSEGLINAIIVDNKSVQTAEKDAELALVLNQTPFYAESGGQKGDQGSIITDAAEIEIVDTVKRANGVFVHIGKVKSGVIKIGDAAKLVVDPTRRNKIKANHSATHLLHEALRLTLGEHVAQKGSLVAPDRLRFDFAHQKPVSLKDLQAVEDIANGVVLQDSPVVTRVMPIADARELGARALFGEKYGDEVRVVTMGKGNDDSMPYSIELCGGTHVNATGEIGIVKIIAEGAVASGVRRIEALCGDAARHYLAEQESHLKTIADVLKTTPQDAANRVVSLVEERKQLERELADARRQIALGGSGGNKAEAETVNGKQFFGQVVEGVDAKDLKPLADEAKSRIGSGIVALVGVDKESGKGSVVVAVTDDLVSSISAVDCVRAASVAMGGKGGGGRPDMAQAGGPDGDKAEAALTAIRTML